MHKIFAKTSYLGKNIISLTDCHSTNDFLASCMKQKSVPFGTIVQTENQTHGRGQRGNRWESEPGKNLIFSFVIPGKDVTPNHQFWMNIVVSLAIIQAISEFIPAPTNLEIKWPNDIYLNDKKLAGILVEASIRGHQTEWFIIGIGLNVGQKHFSSPHATSLQLEKINVDKWMLLEVFAGEFERLFSTYLIDGQKLLDEYYKRLRWYEQTRTFTSEALGQFKGKIKGIDTAGRLLIESNERIYSFDIKEIKFLH